MDEPIERAPSQGDAPPKPLWGNKEVLAEAADKDDELTDAEGNVPTETESAPSHRAAPPKPLWGNKQKPVKGSEDDDAPTDAEGDAPRPPAPMWGAQQTHVPLQSEATEEISETKSRKVEEAMQDRTVYLEQADEEAEVAGWDSLLHADGVTYEIGKTLGVGGYAMVRMCKNKASGELYAVKIFTQSFLKRRKFTVRGWRSNLDGVYREIAIMRELRHPNVMVLHDFVSCCKHLYMIMEYCERGAVMETEKLPCKPLEIVNARRWFADALLGLQYLHYEGIVHHDLKVCAAVSSP